MTTRSLFSLGGTFIVALLISSGFQSKQDKLVLASKGKTAYQVILPDQGNKELEQAAQLISDAFAANGFDLPVVNESRANQSRPGIYLGDTRYARSAGIDPSRMEERSYLMRVAGKDLIITSPGENPLVGVVKGVCDFAREYAGTRFLYPGETGTEFLPTPVISVPAGLDRVREFTLKFNFSGDMYEEESMYNIANNHFPPAFKIGGGPHMWGSAIPYEEYYKEHPEYFALVNGERYDNQRRSQYCISEPRVMELIIEYMVRLADEGNDIIYLGQPDSYTPCECEDCHELYGTGDDWDEKVWLFNREIAERFQKECPDKKILVLAYQVTTHPPKSFTRFQDNTIIKLSHAHDLALHEWSESGAEVPAGFILAPRLFGSHYIVNYLPKRNPEWLEERVKLFHNVNMDIVGLNPMGAIDCYGLEGPAYYVFGRMFDDPEHNNASQLVEEFCTAAFGEAVDPMRRFYGYLHDNLRFLAEWFFPRSESRFFMGLNTKPTGIEDQLDWVRVSTAQFGSRGMHRGIPDPGQGLSLIYTSDLALKMEQELDKAESLARSEKVKKRLELVRMEFTYMKNVTIVNNLYNAWKVQPRQDGMDRLLEGVDAFNELLDSYYGENGRMVSIQGWPEIQPFRGTGRRALGLISARWWKNKDIEENPYAWDTEEIRRRGSVQP